MLILCSVIAILICVSVVVFYFYLKYFNGPDGERYAKLRMQGPFVPDAEQETERPQKTRK